MRISFVGCGAAARPLAIAWLRAGHEICSVVARHSAAEAVHVLGAGTPNGSLENADVVIFGTPDDALADVAAAHPLRADQVAIHLSGVHPSTVLDVTGGRTAGLHPLRAFADVEASVAALPGTFFFVEGAAVETAEALANDLGGHVARIDTAGKRLYHAAAVTASNYVVTLLSVARDLFVDAGVDADRALAALTALAKGAVENTARLGLPAALTGPAARGDLDVIADHVEALGERSGLYLALLEATLPLARAKGGLDAGTEAALRDLIRRGASR